jgi:hypothetical protein
MVGIVSEVTYIAVKTLQIIIRVHRNRERDEGEGPKRNLLTYPKNSGDKVAILYNFDLTPQCT